MKANCSKISSYYFILTLAGLTVVSQSSEAIAFDMDCKVIFVLLVGFRQRVVMLIVI